MTIPNENLLSYVGKEPVKRDFVRRRAPLASDNRSFAIGDNWTDSVGLNSYVKVASAATGATWKAMTSSGSASGIVWNDAAASQIMAVNSGYIITAGAQVFTLPPVSAIGDTLNILLNGGASWQITQTAGQSIVINASTTTVGAGGSITSNGAGQAIGLVCVVANLSWQVTALIGNPTTV